MIALSISRVAIKRRTLTSGCSLAARALHAPVHSLANCNRFAWLYRRSHASVRSAVFSYTVARSKYLAIAGLMCTSSAGVIAFICRDRHQSPIVLAQGSASFSVPSGHLAGKYDAVYISTDLEADDIVAFKTLVPKLRGVPLFVVVGEGSVDGKCKMAAELLAYYGIDDCATIIEGKRSAEKYPAGALSAFTSSRESKAKIIGGDAKKESETFLQAHQSPLAILLKPPHELLGISPDALKKTAAAAYGSFNFIRFRDEISTEDKEAAARAQELFIQSFQRFYWIERSTTVGSNGVLTSNQSLWKHFSDDAGLMKVVYEWNSASVVRTSLRIASMSKKMRNICQKEGDNVLATAETFDEIFKEYQKAEKSIAILQDIATLRGQQICLADPIVTAVLADTKSKFKPYEKVVSFTLNKKGAPKFEVQKSSSVAVLNAGGKTEDITEVILAVLEEMMA